MPEQTTPGAPEISSETSKPDPFKNSPLGQDAEPVAPAATPEPEPEPPELGVSPEELARLQEKASNYDTIVGDDKAMSLLRDHFSGETMNTPDPAPPADDTEYGKAISAIAEKIEKLEGVGQTMQEQLATIVLQDFAKQNPDFEMHRHKVGEIMSAYPGMTLDRALALAKTESGPQEPVSTGERKDVPVRPAAETTSAGEIPGAGDRFQEAERRIANSKEVPDFEAACKLALETAKEHHGVR